MLRAGAWPKLQDGFYVWHLRRVAAPGYRIAITPRRLAREASRLLGTEEAPVQSAARGPLRLLWGLQVEPTGLDLAGETPGRPSGEGELDAVRVLGVADADGRIDAGDLDAFTALAGTAAGLAPFQAWVIERGRHDTLLGTGTIARPAAPRRAQPNHLRTAPPWRCWRS